ncbi:MAG TPA: GatB/YqeY domain-containing protein [Candidatus Baltobacteraceae bacterium]|jgi:hypothetical protein|nr:GatB/YqeY domain-containing protein [Candidatus Baltobacteraceae bacterium]
MTIIERINADLKEAMKAKDQVRVETIRSALSAFSYRKIEAQHEPSQDERIEVLRKLVKQRGDSIVEFERAGRLDLAAKEKREREILEAYLPPPSKTDDELRAIVRATFAALPEGQRTEGGAMKILMPKLKGDADGAKIRALVIEALSSVQG